MFFAGGPGKPIPIHDYIRESLDEIDNPRRVRAGFAYATSDGISELCTLNDSDWRDQVQSEWIVGLDQGLTQPSALDNLYDQTNAEIRVIYPGDDLTIGALYRRPRFHAKLLFLESESAAEQEHLITTSANMTGSALGKMPTNYEVGLVKSRGSGLSDEEVENFEDWWDLAWSESTPLTPELIETYSEIRTEYQEENPDVGEYESSETVSYASDASNLWIETREMTGGSRNQVEFNEQLSGFFSDSGTLPGSVDIEFQGSAHTDRPLNTRTTDPPYGVSICLLYLPTGHDYQHQVIHLEKRDSSGSGHPVFELTVAEPGDDVVDEWRNQARNRGVLDKTSGGREYGYY